MKIIFKQIISFVIILISFFVIHSSLAGPLTQDGAYDVTSPMSNLGEAAGFDRSGGQENPQLATYIASIIKVFLTLLGLIFTVLIIYGGYTWMTAGGSEDKVQKAKDTIKRSVIGFVIVLSAYAITYFVFKNIATSSTTGLG